MTPVESLLANLQGARKVGAGWSARCPAHDDRRASLSISEGDDGRALVKCHAGCTAEAVVSALGLSLRDLMPDRSGPKPTRKRKPTRTSQTFATADAAVAELKRRHGKPAVIWTYTNASGEPVGLVVRWNLPDGKKDIRPVARHPDGWRIGAMPEPRPLYRMPELASVDRIIVCEGEKAADAARSIGFTATTSAGGAQAPGKSDWQPVAGKEIWILPDNDTPGRKYADVVVNLLANLKPTPTVRVVNLPGLPDGGDVVDWLEQRDSLAPDDLRAELEGLAAECVVEQPSASAAEQPAEPSASDWPDPLAPEAFHGLAGKFVRAIEPHTEADPAALLISFLIAVGNVIGRTAFAMADGSRHYTNEFVVVVGQSSKARKGTSWNRVLEALIRAAQEWVERRVLSGLSSGEGLICNVRDPVEGREPVRERGQPVRYETVIKDEGEADKRLLLVESEFANVLKQTERQGNTLSTVIRDAWDKSKLSPLTKTSPITATNPHVSIIGHITREELQRYLSATESANGFANRFLWILVRRSKLLPFGGRPDAVEIDKIARELIHDPVDTVYFIVGGYLPLSRTRP